VTSGRRRRRTRGQALVEFALILPLFVMVLFGVIDLGRYVYSLNAMNEAARESARVGAVALQPAECGALSRNACVRQVLRSRLIAVPIQLTDVQVYCQRKSTVTGALPNQAAEPPIDNCGGTWRPNDLMRVRVTHSFTLVTPLIAQFIGNVPLRGDAQITVNG
jgi:Flp pilus assembly protein TadG